MATPTSLPATFVAGNVLTAAQQNDLRGAFRILQVVTATKTDSFTTNSLTYVDVTGVSVSITPRETASRIFIIVSGVAIQTTSSEITKLNLVRGSTAIGQSTGSGTTNQTLTLYPNNVSGQDAFCITFVDSPSTTSATTYKLQISNQTGGNSLIGRFGANDNFRSITTITAMEVSS